MAQNSKKIPLFYRLFFLYVEPLSALSGAICAGLYPSHYLVMTERIPSQSPLLPLGIHVALRQLANMYLLFALNEALILRATNDLRIWRALLLNLLIADLGHLYSLLPLGYSVYFDFWNWNAMDWGNVPFVYLGMASRLSFLLGWGFKSRQD